MPSNSVAMSSIESMATPTRPTSPAGQRMVRVVADLRRQVERDAQTLDALRQQISVSAIRLRGGGKPRVLPHGPGPAAIHVGLDAAREWKRAWLAEAVAGSVPARSSGVRNARDSAPRSIECVPGFYPKPLPVRRLPPSHDRWQAGRL